MSIRQKDVRTKGKLYPLLQFAPPSQNPGHATVSVSRHADNPARMVVEYFRSSVPCRGGTRPSPGTITSYCLGGH